MRKDMPGRCCYGKKMAPMDVVRMQGLLEQEHRRVSEVASTFAQGCLCGLQVERESPLLCIGNTCELDNWDVHATVLHGDGVEFGAYGPPPRRNVCM